MIDETDGGVARADCSNDENLPPVENLRDAERELLNLFQRILHHHGLEKTREMFANYCREPGKPELDHMYELQLLKRLKDMTPKPNVKKLARLLMAENAASPTPIRELVPIPDNPEDEHLIRRNLEQYIYRLKKKQPELAARFAPVSPPLKPGEPAKFTITPTAPLPFRTRLPSRTRRKK